MAVDVQFGNDYSAFLGDFIDDDCSTYHHPLHQYFFQFDEQQQLLFQNDAIVESSYYDLQQQLQADDLESLMYMDIPPSASLFEDLYKPAAVTTTPAQSIENHCANFLLDHQFLPNHHYDQLLANSHQQIPINPTVLSRFPPVKSSQPAAPSFGLDCVLTAPPPIWFDSIPATTDFAKRPKFTPLQPCNTFIDPTYRYHHFQQEYYTDHLNNFHHSLTGSMGAADHHHYPTGGSYLGGINSTPQDVITHVQHHDETNQMLLNSEVNSLRFAPGITTLVSTNKQESLIVNRGETDHHHHEVKSSTSSSTTAQSRAARERRRKIAHKMQELGKLLPSGKGGGCGIGGGGKMNTAEMLQAAFKYVKFLQAQVSILQLMKSRTSSLQKIGGSDATIRTTENLRILGSEAVQEMLYMEEKCLAPTEFLTQLAEDENLIEMNPLAASNLKQLLMSTNASSSSTQDC